MTFWSLFSWTRARNVSVSSPVYTYYLLSSSLAAMLSHMWLNWNVSVNSCHMTAVFAPARLIRQMCFRLPICSIYKSKTTSSDQMNERINLFIPLFFSYHISAFPSTFFQCDAPKCTSIHPSIHPGRWKPSHRLDFCIYLHDYHLLLPAAVAPFDFKDLYSTNSHKSLLMDRRKRKKMSRFRS